MHGRISSSRGTRAIGAIREQFATVVKLLVAAGLVFGLFYYKVITFEALHAMFRNSPIAAATFGVLLVGYVLSVLRWYFLLKAMGVHIRLRPCAEIFAMGTFANTFLPGGIGGDFVRAVYIARHVQQDRAGAVISIFADRAMGLFGMTTIAVLLGLSTIKHVNASPLTQTLFFMIVVAFATAALGIAAALVLISPARFEKIKTFVGSRTILHRGLARLFATLLQLRTNPLPVLASFLLSVVITSTIAISAILLADGYDAGGLGALDFANASILALIANSVPITPGGIGVAESAFSFLCYAWEKTPTTLAYGTIFFGCRLILTVISLFGSVAFVTYRRVVALAWEDNAAMAKLNVISRSTVGSDSPAH